MACDTDRLIRLGSRTLNTKTGTVSYPNRATVRDCIKRRSRRGLLHRISSAAKDAREARDCTTQERAGLDFEVRLISRFSRRLSGREGCSSGSCRKPDSLGLAMVPWAGNGCPEHSLARESGIRLPAPSGLINPVCAVSFSHGLECNRGHPNFLGKVSLARARHYVGPYKLYQDAARDWFLSTVLQSSRKPCPRCHAACHRWVYRMADRPSCVTSYMGRRIWLR